MVKKILVFLLVSLLLMLGCASPVPGDNPRIGYLPDGRMVLLQSSGEDKAVTFPDANLELVVREKLESLNTLAAGESIYTTDLEEIVYLEASGRNITDLKGLENCINLGYLDLCANSIVDLSPLSHLPGALLCSKDLKGNVIRTYTVLCVELAWNNLTDIMALEGLSDADELILSLAFNEVEDLSPLMGLTNLLNLYLCENRIKDITPLGGLTKLVNLELWGNEISDLSPLEPLIALCWLELCRNNIVDISALAKLTNLDSLYLSHNDIVDVVPLAALISLRYLDLSSNNISDASALEGLKDTEINLSGNPVEDMP